MTTETKENKQHHLNNKQLCNNNHFAVVSSFISNVFGETSTDIKRNAADINVFKTKSYCKCC